MQDKKLEGLLDNANKALADLSTYFRDTDSPLVYRVNRSWRELDGIREAALEIEQRGRCV